MAILLYAVGVIVALAAYLWHCERAISVMHPEAAKHVQKAWTDDMIKKAYVCYGKRSFTAC